MILTVDISWLIKRNISILLKCIERLTQIFKKKNNTEMGRNWQEGRNSEKDKEQYKKTGELRSFINPA